MKSWSPLPTPPSGPSPLLKTSSTCTMPGWRMLASMRASLSAASIGDDEEAPPPPPSPPSERATLTILTAHSLHVSRCVQRWTAPLTPVPRSSPIS